jgi:putative sugar O-methyltransferase
MYKYVELNMAFEDMLSQNELYAPTHFWREASVEIINEINEYGIDAFRSISSALNFFVPTYGFPGGGFSKDQIEDIKNLFNIKWPNSVKPKLAIENLLNGYFSALSDYRVFKGVDDIKILPHLHTFTESQFGEPIEQFQFDGRKFSRSSLNYLLGLTMLKRHLNGEAPSKVLEIGGGFGTLGEILASSNVPGFKYIDIDIPPTSFVAQKYLMENFGQKNVLTYAQTKDLKLIKIDELPKFSVLCSWQIEKLVGNVDLFVNFISFQEMEPHIVRNYLGNVDRFCPRWVLLRNMKEGKNITNGKDVGVITPILGDDYLEMLPNYELIERNVIPFGLQTVDGFNSELILMRLKK